MSYELIAVAALSKVRPTMGMPLFKRTDSNRPFVHDLRPNGTIRRFLEVPDGTYEVIQNVNIPPLSVDIGSKGVFVILDAEGVSFVGNRDDLSNHFLDFDYLGSTLAIEAASSLADEERLFVALSSISWAEKGGPFRNWKAMERRTFEATTDVRAGKSSVSSGGSPELEADYALLTSHPESDEWSKTWFRLWQEGYRRAGLIKIACWRVDSGYSPQEGGGYVYLTAAQANDDINYVGKYVIRWLKEASITDNNWISIAASVWARRIFRDEILEIVLERLHDEVAPDKLVTWAWRRLWQFAWGRLTAERELVDLAASYFANASYLSAYDGEMLSYLMRRKENIGQFYGVIVAWLGQNPRNTLTWADLFLVTASERWSEELIDAGRRWLSEYGGTTNRWATIWEALEGYLPEGLHFHIGLEWLQRARWDLRCWPRVYGIVAFRARHELDVSAVRNLGARWLNSRNRWHRDWEEVRKVFSHISDRE